MYCKIDYNYFGLKNLTDLLENFNEQRYNVCVSAEKDINENCKIIIRNRI